MLLSEADPVTRRHQALQLQNVRQAQGEVARLWALMNFLALDESAAQFTPLAVRVIEAARMQSALLAARWYSAWRQGEVGSPVPNGPGLLVREGIAVPARSLAMTDLSVQRTTGSLLINGPVSVKRAVGNGLARQEAMNLGLSKTLATTQKQVLDAGRETTLDLMQRERRTVLYRRVTREGACDFCLTLATKVYTALTVRFSAHDNCACMMQPAFKAVQRRAAEAPGRRGSQRTVYEDREELSGPVQEIRI